MLQLIDKFFDNSIGKLDEPESYQKICKDIGQEPASCAFLTKNVSGTNDFCENLNS